MADQPSRQTLDDVPRRVLAFLIAVGESLPIRGALAIKGYTEQEHGLAWGLLQKLTGLSPAGAPVLDQAVRDAITTLDAWDEPNFACIQATLARLHPEQATFVFENLGPKQGPESVIAVATLLDRLDSLENGPDRKATRKADHAALATIVARGYTKAERDRLRGLVTTAQKMVVAQPLSDDDRTKALVELHGWLMDWSTSAKAVIKRRDHLIRLGLAKRKKTGKAPQITPPEPAAPKPEPAAGTS